MVNLLSWPPLAFRAFRNGWQPLSSPRARLRQSAARAEKFFIDNAAGLADFANWGKLGGVALLEQPQRLMSIESCMVEAPKGHDAIGAIGALKSCWQPLRT